jgi:hypothetical protein
MTLYKQNHTYPTSPLPLSHSSISPSLPRPNHPVSALPSKFVLITSLVSDSYSMWCRTRCLYLVVEHGSGAGVVMKIPDHAPPPESPCAVLGAAASCLV